MMNMANIQYKVVFSIQILLLDVLTLLGLFPLSIVQHTMFSVDVISIRTNCKIDQINHISDSLKFWFELGLRFFI